MTATKEPITYFVLGFPLTRAGLEHSA